MTDPLAAATPALPPPVARLLHTLAWPAEGIVRPPRLEEAWRRRQRPAPGTAPVPGTTGDRPVALPFELLSLVEGGLRQLLLLVTPHAGVLPRRHDLLLRAIDTAPPLDGAVEVARALAGSGEHALVADHDAFYLIDLDREEILLAGDHPHQWDEHLTPALAGGRATLRRRLAALPRRTAVQSGLELRRFLDRVARALAEASGEPREAARDLALGLLASFHHWRFEPRPAAAAPPTLWDQLAWGAAGGERDPTGEGAFDLRLLATTFEEGYRRAPLRVWRLGERDRWLARWSGLAVRDRRGELSRLLEDFFRLARPRLAQEVYEVALLDEDQLYRSTRSRLQSRLPPMATLGLHHVGPIVYRPAEVNVAEVGVGWALDLLGGMLEYWRSLKRQQLERAAPPGGYEADLFLGATPAADDAGRIEDPAMASLHDSIRFTHLGELDLSTLEFLIAVTVWTWAWGASPEERPSLASLPRLLA